MRRFKDSPTGQEWASISKRRNERENKMKIKDFFVGNKHRKRHILLHRYLDELVADFITVTRKFPSKTNLLKFMEWSYQQTKEPKELNNGLETKTR